MVSSENEDTLLESAFQSYFCPIVKFLRSREHDEATAEDLAQSAFLKFTEHKNRSGIKDVEAFLFRVALNLSTNLNRNRKKRKAFIEAHEETHFVQPAQVVCPEQQAILHEKIRILELLIANLPERRREVFLLCVFFQYTYSEVAKKLGITESTVRAQFSNAVRDCRWAITENSTYSESGENGQEVDHSVINGCNGRKI